MKINGKEVTSADIQKLVGRTVVLKNGSYASGALSVYGNVGAKIKIKSITLQSHNNVNDATAVRLNNISSWLYLGELALTANTTKDILEEIEALEKEKAAADEQIKQHKIRISFMEENKLNEFDDQQFKIYAVLQTIKEASSDVEKARAIAKLIAE